MSVDYDFHQHNQKQPLAPEFIKDKLSEEFFVTNLILDEQKKLAKGFTVKPKNDSFGNISKVELEFYWQDRTKNRSGEYRSPEELQEIEASALSLYCYRNCGGYGGTEQDNNDYYKYVARISELLDFYIDDPQLGLTNVPPAKFASPDLLQIEYLKRREKEKIKNSLEDFYDEIFNPSYWWALPLRLPRKRSFLSGLIPAVIMIFLIFLTFVFNLGMFIIPLLILTPGLIGRGNDLAILLTASSLLFIHFIWMLTNYNHPNFQQNWQYYENIASLLLFLYTAIYLLLNGIRWVFLRPTRNRVIDETLSKIYNRPGEPEQLQKLKVRFVTKKGILLFLLIIFLYSTSLPIIQFIFQ